MHGEGEQTKGGEERREQEERTDSDVGSTKHQRTLVPARKAVGEAVGAPRGLLVVGFIREGFQEQWQTEGPTWAPSELLHL